ncbi:hypothetical protein HDU67_003468 [Dinochytrium kinnereticum]|nr:hypothetical protein HDU67_003468 [Dinochytrium kinnereticum]
MVDAPAAVKARRPHTTSASTRQSGTPAPNPTTPSAIITTANCKTRTFPRQQKRLDRVRALETAMKVASTGGIALMDGFDDMVGTTEHVQDKRPAPLPNLRDPVSTLATKALLQDLEHGGGLTLEQAAVIRRVMTAGDKHRRKLVAQLSLVVARGSITQARATDATSIQASAEAASRALERMKVEPPDRCYPPRSAVAAMSEDERAKIIRSRSTWTPRGRIASSRSRKTEEDGEYVEEWKREDEEGDEVSLDGDRRAESRVSVSIPMSSKPSLQERRPEPPPPMFQISVPRGGFSGGEYDDNDSDGGVPLIYVQSESASELKITVPNLSSPLPQPDKYGLQSSSFSHSASRLSVSPLASRSSSFSHISSNETDDSLKFDFPIVKPEVQGTIGEVDEEESNDVDGVPKIVIDDNSPASFYMSSVFSDERTRSRLASRQNSVQQQSRQPSIIQHSHQNSIFQSPSSRPDGRRRDSVTSSVENDKPPKKSGRLTAYSGNDSARELGIDEDDNSGGSESSGDSSGSETDGQSSHASSRRTGLGKTAFGRNLGIGLKINTKVKNPADLPTSKRKRGSPMSALKFYRNPKSPYAPKEDWEVSVNQGIFSHL